VRYWTMPEIQLLKDRYKKEGPTILAAELGRTPKGVLRKAQRLNLLYRVKRVKGKPDVKLVKSQIEPPNKICATLRKRREILGMTCLELGRALGVSKATIWSWETGDHSPSIERLMEWADFFDLSVCLTKKRNKWH